MASAIGIALISTILEPMTAKAMEKVKAMVVNRVDGIVNIERDISKLQETLSMIQDILQVAEEKQIDKQGKPRVFIQNWLRRLVDIAYEARDVLDDFITFSSCVITAEEASNPPVNFISSFMPSYFGGSSSDTSNIPLTVLNRLEKDIRSVSERFDEKKKEGETFATLKSESVKPRTPVGPFINKQRDGPFLGREEMKQEIVEKILHPSDDRVDVVVIWGMGGIGKTTLAQLIYNDERVRVKKVSRSWVCVGERKFCAEKVIREIVNDKETIGFGNLDAKLQEELSRDRFLIVLDDVWDVEGSEWDLLFNPLTHVGKGGLIIITRRARQLCATITIQAAYNLELLSEQDSWSIFKSRAFIDGNSDSRPNLKCIGKKIVKKLNGLPLALEVVGRSLLNKDSSTWTDFLESRFPKDDEVMSALRWSYNHLPRHLKTCFTYCALFPKDHVFYDEKVLVEMWMAHDLIQKEDVGAQYFEQLLNASLLQCVDGKYFKQYVMHDLIYDLALLVSNGEFATANSLLTNDQMERVRHVTITRREYSKVPRLCKMEKLLTLYTTGDEIWYKNYRKDSTLVDVFNQLKSIRVLVLDSLKITNIPDCISELRHLRYLDVSETEVKSLPDSLCHLYNLQMIAANVVLPRDVVNMVNLRYIRASLSTCKGVGKLTSLQELSSIDVCEGDNIRELGDMQILRGELRIGGLGNVEKLEDDIAALMEKQTLMDALELNFDEQLEKSTISEKVLDSLGCPPNLTYLKISGYTGVKSPNWMVDRKHKLYKLQILELSSCPKLESLPPLGELTSYLHKRSSLRKLIIEKCPQLQSLPQDFHKLSSLKTLRIYDCPQLQSLSRDFHKLSYLEELNINRCPQLQSLPAYGFPPSLTYLGIISCPLLYERCKDESALDCHFLTSLSRLEIRDCYGLKRLQLDALVSLKKLKISNCSSLVQITSARCESLEISSCRLLEKMDVARCDSLVVIKILKLEDCVSLRSLSIDIHGLDSLEDLRIYGCPTLELAFEDGSSSSSSSGNSVAVPIHNISTDNTQVFRTLLHHEIVSLESLAIRELKGFENFDATEANNFCKLRSLKSLDISQCEDLKSLSPDFHKLSSLEELNIYDCPQLQSLPTDGLPPSLRVLEIRGCPQLQLLPLDFYKLSSLKLLYIEDCSQLQSLHANGLPPSLSNLRIIYCPGVGLIGT